MADVERRLSAIVCADVVGYSRLMGLDETGTLAALKGHRQAVDPLFTENGGRIVKTTGDGLLIEFPSVVEAVRSAVAVQRAMAERNAVVAADRRMLLRIGIHLGDVIIEDGDIFGDGVNIAARLQEVAEPGGICLSQLVHESVRGRVEATFADAGTQSLKNIAQPVRVYRLGVAAGPRPVAPDAPARRLSIVVLPFLNLSRDLEQEYFVDGLTESLTTELSRIAGAFVIARNSAFTYKGKAVDVKQVGRELGVHYVLEGSVQAAGSRVRVNAQLIDTESGAHLWGDRFDGKRGDLFDLQDEIVTRLARSLDFELTEAEAARVERLRAQDPDSTDLAIRGWALSNRSPSVENFHSAIELFERALAIDERNVDALAGLSLAHGRLALNWLTDNPSEHFQAGERAALQAIALDPGDARAHYALAYSLVGTDRGEQAVGEFERALALNRNLASAHALIGMCMRFIGRPEESEAYARASIALSPRDPQIGSWYFQIGAAALQLGELEKAVLWLRRSVEADRHYATFHFFLASALARQGLIEEAHAVAAAALALDPTFTVRRMRDGAPAKKGKVLTQWEPMLDGMRKAGLPE
jgi:TolB-like protein/class 3 adenylate cyclase